MTGPRLTIVPVDWQTARGFVADWHRHNRPPVGWRFGIGVETAGQLVGVAVVGRPVARHTDDGMTLEVTRCTTDGTPNACSALYGAAWRAAKALGYRRLITFTRADESGSSLRGAGWRVIAERPKRSSWDTPSRRRGTTTDAIARTLWEAGSSATSIVGEGVWNPLICLGRRPPPTPKCGESVDRRPAPTRSRPRHDAARLWRLQGRVGRGSRRSVPMVRRPRSGPCRGRTPTAARPTVVALGCREQSL